MTRTTIQPASNSTTPPRLFLIGSQKSGTTWLRDCLNHFVPFPVRQEWYLPEIAEKIERHVHDYRQRMTPDQVRERQHAVVRAAWEALNVGASGDKSAYPCTTKLNTLRPDLHPRAVSIARDYFPEARLVVIVRDPRAVLNSLVHFLEWYKPGWSAGIDPRAFAEQWLLQNSTWKRDQPDYFVRYEDLKTNFLPTLSALLTAIGIAHDDSVLRRVQEQEYDISRRKDEQPDIYRKGIIDEWRRTLPPQHCRAIREAAGPFLAECGYELDLDEDSQVWWLQSEIKRLNADLEILRGQAAQVQADLERFHGEAEQLRTEREHLRSELESTRTKLGEMRQALDAWRVSKSYRVTAPARAIAKLIRGK